MSSKPRAVVVGGGFGRNYARALAHPGSPVELAAIVGRGGPRSTALAQELGVPVWSSAELENQPLDLAVVAVRSAIIGGMGDSISASLLSRGVAVIQELPIHSTSVIELLRQARRGTTVFHPSAFYDRLATTRRFTSHAIDLRKRVGFENVLVRTCCQTLHDALLVLSGFMAGPPPRDARVTNRRGHARVDLDWAGVPVDIQVGNRMDTRDPDAHSQPLMAFVVSTSEGELELGHVHGPTVFMPMAPSTTDGLDPNAPVAVVHGEELLTGQLLGKLWPEAIHSAVKELLAGKQSFGQRELATLKLWEKISPQLASPLRIGSDETTSGNLP